MSPPSPAVPAGLEERTTAHRGGTVRYLVGGSGPAMLLCHGFIGSAENYSDWLPALLPRRTLVVPDLPGFGCSPALQAHHGAAAMACAALAALDDSGLDGSRFDLGGLCLGASVALAAQRQRPSAVRSLVLHTPLVAPWLVRRRFHLQVGVMLSAAVFPGIVWLSRQRRVSDLYKRLMVEGADVDAQAALVNFQNQLRATPHAAREWLRDGLRRDDLAQLRSARAPALVLIAEADRIVDVTRLGRALSDVRDVQIALIRGGGHAWTRAMIEAQQAALAAFLDGRPLPQLAAAVAA
jgi:pimeloyl-ACP methyl ester carboxylesterase